MQITLSWHNYFATAYRIDLSDDNTNWTTIFSTTNGSGGLENVELSNASGRYVRLMSTAWNNESYRIWLNEIEIYGTPGQPVPDDTPTPTVTPMPTPSTTPEPTGAMHVGDLDGSYHTAGQKSTHGERDQAAR